MAYEPTTWNDGDVITAEKMNKLEQGVKNEQVGPAGKDGDPGPAGKGVKSIELYTTEGAVTGGKVTYTDESTGDITVSQQPAG